MGRQIEPLKAALAAGKQAGVDKKLIDEAEGVLKVEEPKAEARVAIEKAVESGNVDALKAAIEKAKAANLDKKEYKAAEEAIAREAEKERLKGVLKEAVDKSKNCNEKEIESIQAAKGALSETISQAKAVGVEEVYLKDAELRRRKMHNM